MAPVDTRTATLEMTGTNSSAQMTRLALKTVPLMEYQKVTGVVSMAIDQMEIALN